MGLCRYYDCKLTQKPGDACSKLSTISIPLESWEGRYMRQLSSMSLHATLRGPLGSFILMHALNDIALLRLTCKKGHAVRDCMAKPTGPSWEMEQLSPRSVNLIC